jgi:hypothetical protein
MELTINNLIKIILGLLVVGLVIFGVAVVATRFTDFFKNIPDATNLFMVLK